MKERPILFSGAMVRAILDGSKTQTRRIVKPTMTKPNVAPLRMEPWVIGGDQETDDNGAPLWAGFHHEYPGDAKWFSCPYGQPGDLVWVRETFHLWGPPEHQILEYRADCTNPNDYTWKPSIFMPRKHSRITLEITDVRVERVQDISAEDKEAEGLLWSQGCGPAAFEALWNDINAKRGYGWSVNPWVWAITFRRIV